jgi:hypothetical protein
MYTELSLMSASFEIFFHHASAKTNVALDMKKAAQAEFRKQQHVENKQLEGQDDDDDAFEFSDLSKIPDAQRFSNDMSRNHKVFRNISPLKARIILCPPQTYVRRYGPRRLQDDLESRWMAQVSAGSMSEQTLGFLRAFRSKAPGFFSPDRTWKLDLKGCFRMVLVDESQSIRKPFSQIHQALIWVDADQYHCFTATPVWNSERDLRGPLNMLARPDNDEAFKKLDKHPRFQELKSLRENPFSHKGMKVLKGQDKTLPDAILKGLMCYKAFDRWVKVGDGFAVNTNAAQLYLINDCIRHTYASSMPGDRPDLAIGNALPKLVRRNVTIELEPDQLAIYCRYATVHQKRLRMQIADDLGLGGDDNDQSGINRGAVRCLTVPVGAPFLALVGIEADDPLIDDVVNAAKARRDKHVKAVQDKAREAARREAVDEANAGKIAKWEGFPELPKMGEVLESIEAKVPSK